MESQQNKIYGIICVKRHLSGMYYIENFDLKCTIKRVQTNQGGWKLNGTHQLLVLVADVNTLGAIIHTKPEIQKLRSLLVRDWSGSKCEEN